jgi:hypothetical protein
MAKDYIPNNDAAFDTWFKFLNQYVAGKCGGSKPEWTHIPVDARTGMNNAYTAWAAAYARIFGPHTPVDTAAKNDAKKAAKKVIRPFVNQFLRYLPVTDDDRRAMGIPVKDTRPTPVPKPEDVPEAEVSTPLPRVLRFRFRRPGAKRWGKPEGVHGLELLWVVLDRPPLSLKELLHSSFATKSPLELVFDEEDRGRRVYFAARWETGTVKKGPESEIFSAIIP